MSEPKRECICHASWSGYDEAEYRARGCPPCECWKVDAYDALAKKVQELESEVFELKTADNSLRKVVVNFERQNFELMARAEKAEKEFETCHRVSQVRAQALTQMTERAEKAEKELGAAREDAHKYNREWELACERISYRDEQIQALKNVRAQLQAELEAANLEGDKLYEAARDKDKVQFTLELTAAENSQLRKERDLLKGDREKFLATDDCYYWTPEAQKEFEAAKKERDHLQTLDAANRGAIEALKRERDELKAGAKIDGGQIQDLGEENEPLRALATELVGVLQREWDEYKKNNDCSGKWDVSENILIEHSPDCFKCQIEAALTKAQGVLNKERTNETT